MWLLDVNLPNGLLKKLEKLGIKAETTAYRGWRNLGNGKLSEAAFGAGFKVILTRDRLCSELKIKNKRFSFTIRIERAAFAKSADPCAVNSFARSR